MNARNKNEIIIMWASNKYCEECKEITSHHDGECYECEKRRVEDWPEAWKNMPLEEKVEYLYNQLKNLKDHSVFRGRLG